MYFAIALTVVTVLVTLFTVICLFGILREDRKGKKTEEEAVKGFLILSVFSLILILCSGLVWDEALNTRIGQDDCEVSEQDPS